MSYGMGPRKKTAGEIAQMVGGQLQGPVADQVRRRLDAWNNPVAKLDRRHRRAGRAMTVWFSLLAVLSVIGLFAFLGVFAVGVGVGMSQDLEGGRLQGVAGQDGGGLVIGLVHGGSAPAHVVVVHAGQVVVDQAVGLDAFERARRAQDRALRQVEHAAGLQGEIGPQALAGPERRIAHGLGQAALGALASR